MFKINRKVEYALLALKHMQQTEAGKLTSAKEICEAHKIPFDPTSRVLQIMTQHGVLKAEQGAHGGYLLAKKLSDVTLFDIALMITGPIGITNCCNVGYADCSHTSTCNLINPMLKLNQKISEVFKNTSIKDFLGVHKQKGTTKKPALKGRRQ